VQINELLYCQKSKDVVESVVAIINFIYLFMQWLSEVFSSSFH